MRQVALIGVGMHPWGKFPDKSFLDCAVVAVRAALKDAGAKWSDMQAIVAGLHVHGGMSGFNPGPSLAAILGETGVPITNIFNMCATATSAFRSAYDVVASGDKDICIVVGADMSPKGFLPTLGKEDPRESDYLRWRMMGLTNPGYWAMECRKRMQKYGTTERHLALTKVAASKHGALNPNALYKKVYTEEEVLNSAMVCDPLRLFNICATRDGAVAAILCTVEKARQFTAKPLIVAGVGLGSSLYDDPTLRLGYTSCPTNGSSPLLSESYQSAHMAFDMAGIGPEDVDFVEVPDNSSWHYLQYIETMGFCSPGEADRLVENGDTLVGGKLPVCTSGGVSSFGEAVAAQGLLQVYELVVQLRGQGGGRQVKDAKVGMSQTYGMLGNSAATILKR